MLFFEFSQAHHQVVQAFNIVIHRDKYDDDIGCINAILLSHFITACLPVESCKCIHVNTRMNHTDVAGIDIRIFLEEYILGQMRYGNKFMAFPTFC